MALVVARSARVRVNEVRRVVRHVRERSKASAHYATDQDETGVVSAEAVARIRISIIKTSGDKNGEYRGWKEKCTEHHRPYHRDSEHSGHTQSNTTRRKA